MKFEPEYFQKFGFETSQIKQYYVSAKHDLEIAMKFSLADVTFKFSYDALIKLGITVIAKEGYKVRSNAGHHFKIIEKLAEILDDENVAIVANKMRQTRNFNLYDGGYLISEKESREYLKFVNEVFYKVKRLLCGCRAR